MSIQKIAMFLGLTLTTTEVVMGQAKTLLELSGTNIETSLKDSVLILIDYQNEYRTGGLKLYQVERSISETAKALAMARRQNVQVVHVIHDGGKGGLFDLTQPSGKIMDELKPQADETTIKKTKPNAFAETDLGQVLKTAGKRKLVILGLMSHMCLSATVRAAFDFGYEVTTIASTTTTRDLPGAHGDIKARAITDVSLAALQDRFARILLTPEDLR